MKKVRVLALVAASAGTLVTVSAASAADYLYYQVAGAGMNNVGRVQLDGTTGRDDAFASFTDNVAGLAATDSAAYVVSQQQNSNNKTLWKVDASTKAKTNVLGSALMCSTVSGTTAYGLATDGDYLYYICESGTTPQSATRYLARVSLDGSSINETFSGALTGIHSSSETFTVGGGYAYFKGGSSGGFGADRLYRVPLTAGATATASSGANPVQQVAWSSAGLFSMDNPSGPTRSLSRYVPSDFPGWTPTTWASGLSTGFSPVLAANAKNLYWVVGGQGMPTAIAQADATAAGTPNTSFFRATSPSSFGSYVAVNPKGPTGDSPAPAPAPAPAPTPAPAPAAATVLRAPTQTATANADGNVAVTLALQLDDVGKYTFIFEKVTSNEMSREAASSSRISMQKGTKIGKRKLTKAVTAANVTTTSAGAKVVMKALLKKAQAKKWNLRVIHTAADGAQSQSVISK